MICACIRTITDEFVKNLGHGLHLSFGKEEVVVDAEVEDCKKREKKLKRLRKKNFKSMS